MLATEVGEVELDPETAAAAEEVRLRVQLLGRHLNKAIHEVEDLRKSGTVTVNDLEAAWRKVDEIRDDQYALIASVLHWRYSPNEVRSWFERGVEMGASHMRIGAQLLDDLLYSRKVPNAPLREWIDNCEQSVESVMEILAEATGREDRQLRRNFGMGVQEDGKSEKPMLTLFADYDLIATCAAALGIDPYEIGV